MKKKDVEQLAPGTKPNLENCKEPKLPLFVQISLPVRLAHWPGFYGSCTMRMRFNDNEVRIVDKDIEYGNFCGTIGGDIEFTIYDKKGKDKNEGGHKYRLDKKDLWNAFAAAVGRQDLILRNE